MAQFVPFDNEFRQRANGMRRTPSPQAWNRIERRLSRRNNSSGPRLLGLRPWMIAALFLIIAGIVGLSTITERQPSPLAQRSQTVEDLENAFAPADNFDADVFRGQLESTAVSDQGAGLPADFRDVQVAKKYQS